MRMLRLTLVAAASLVCAGCLEMTSVMKVNGDGSGTLNVRSFFTNQGLAQLKMFGGRGQVFDPASEAYARSLAEQIGTGVTYVSSEAITTPAGQGRDATYAFPDVTQVRALQQTGTGIGFGGAGGGITFGFTRVPGGNAVLRIRVPQPTLPAAMPGALQQPGATPNPAQLAMVRQMVAGARLLVAVEPAGRLVQTSSPYVDGSRVTLLELDIDRFLTDEMMIRLLQMKATDDLQALLKGAEGLKITLDPETTIEFAP
jgi:hypothetical protein